jgi:hypothetical protein
MDRRKNARRNRLALGEQSVAKAIANDKQSEFNGTQHPSPPQR